MVARQFLALSGVAALTAALSFTIKAQEAGLEVPPPPRQDLADEIAPPRPDPDTLVLPILPLIPEDTAEAVPESAVTAQSDSPARPLDGASTVTPPPRPEPPSTQADLEPIPQRRPVQPPPRPRSAVTAQPSVPETAWPPAPAQESSSGPRRTNEIVGRTVRTESGRVLGQIADIVLDDDTGRVRYFVLDDGQSVQARRVQGEFVAIPWIFEAPQTRRDVGFDVQTAPPAPLGQPTIIVEPQIIQPRPQIVQRPVYELYQPQPRVLQPHVTVQAAPVYRAPTYYDYHVRRPLPSVRIWRGDEDDDFDDDLDFDDDDGFRRRVPFGPFPPFPRDDEDEDDDD